MKRKNISFTRLFLFAAVLVFPTLIFAAGRDCAQCHQKYGVTVTVPQIPPIRVMVNEKEEIITLERAFKFHGHECPGMTIAYLAIQYGVNLLFNDEIPERSDLLIASRMPSAGAKDLIDLLMKGENPSKRTWPPVGMKNSRSGFVFTITRKSKCEAVEVRLNEAFFPADFFLLKQKEKEGSITGEEWKRLHTYMKDIILKYPVKPIEELFGRPKPYKVIVWGTLGPGESDRHIRKMRQEEREGRNIKPERQNSLSPN